MYICMCTHTPLNIIIPVAALLEGCSIYMYMYCVQQLFPVCILGLFLLLPGMTAIKVCKEMPAEPFHLLNIPLTGEYIHVHVLEL